MDDDELMAQIAARLDGLTEPDQAEELGHAIMTGLTDAVCCHPAVITLDQYDAVFAEAVRQRAMEVQAQARELEARSTGSRNVASAAGRVADLLAGSTELAEQIGDIWNAVCAGLADALAARVITVHEHDQVLAAVRHRFTL